METKIPEPTNSTIHKINTFHETKHRSDSPRLYMGISSLGHACERWLWLSFHRAIQPTFDGRMHRLFRRGHLEESTIVEDLRAIGIEVIEAEDDQRQLDAGCFVKGSPDGIALSGVPEAPKTVHLLEFKTHNDKSFKDLQKNGVEKAKPMHYIQMQCYMHEHPLKPQRALYIAVNKNDDSLYIERVKYDKEVAEKYIKRGQRIALEDRLPAPISPDGNYYQCRWCDAKDLCFESKICKEINCRTCFHAQAREDSTFYCAHHQDTIPETHQLKDCGAHVMHPDLVPYQLVANKGTANSLAYRMDDGQIVLNGIDGMPTHEFIAITNVVKMFDGTWIR